jgi:hypothetical protein
MRCGGDGNVACFGPAENDGGRAELQGGQISHTR